MEGELVLVCQDRCPTLNSNFKTYKHFNLQTDKYNKPYFCNFGVKQATHEIVALIDSDRILPSGYFLRAIEMTKENTAITTINLYQILHPCTDSQIEKGEFETREDFRSKENAGGRKNLFAGNTVFQKEDYFKWGGMDENFVGYGFSDMDMTTSAEKNRCDIIYLQETELHLYHQREITWCGKIVSPEIFRIITATNALRYCNKWKTIPDIGMSNIIEIVDSKLDTYPEDLVEEYLKLKGSILNIKMP